MRKLPIVVGAVALLCGCRPDDPSRALPATEITVVQRQAELVPGSDGRLRVELGDITAGQVLVRVVAVESGGESGGEPVSQRSMRLGDAVEFDFDGHRYGLVVSRLVNHLIGDDFAVFQLTSPDAVGPAQIDALLRRMESSELTFVRNGEDHSGEDAAAHLRRKWEFSGAEIRDPETFIDELATRSSLSGEEYLVRLGGDRTMALAGWLRGEPVRAP